MYKITKSIKSFSPLKEIEVQITQNNEIELKKSKMFIKISITIAIFSFIISAIIAF